MAYSCCICHAIIQSISGLCTHIRLLHPDNCLSSYKCCNCPKTYSTLQCLREHLKKKHPEGEIENPEIENLDLPFHGVNNDMQEDNENIHDILLENNVEEQRIIPPVTVFDFKKALYESTLALSAKLYSIPSFNRSQVQDILNLASDYACSGFVDIIQAKAVSLLQMYGCPEQDVKDLTEMFSSLQDGLSGLQTESQRKNALEQSNYFIRPISYHIGERETLRYVNGVALRTQIETTGQYISISQTLKYFLELPNVLHAILDNIQKLEESDTFSNIIQSPLWKRIKATHFQNRLVFPLVFYFDDTEPDNQTGSHSGEHSLGLVYYQIPCIPQHLLSSLENIFLAAVFLTHDRSFGNEETFRPILRDLQDLETNGIRVEVGGQIYQIFFSLALLIGDNKGINGMTGFVESFRANYFCRICKEHRNVTEKQLRENGNMLRNPVNYAADLLQNDYSLTGLKTECTWNQLQSYHCSINIALDFMHDFLEGVCHYDLCAILSVLLREGYFTLETLNERIQFFDYGFEANNKVTVITTEHLRREKLKMSASEMFCFVRHLGLMVGDLIPAGNEIWKLYLLLMEIINIVVAPYVQKETAQYLSTLIAEHHEVYQSVFNKTLKPKYHFMVHIPRVMMLIGPLIHVSSMRMEGKHRPVVKITAKSHTCRKNMPVTTALRYSLANSARFVAKRGFPPDVIFHDEERHIQEVENFDEFRNVLPGIYANSWCVKKVSIYGTEYKRNMVLALNHENDLPLFGLVHWIVKPLDVNAKAWFILSGFSTIGFNQHLNSYEVEPSVQWFFVEYHQLSSFYPSKCRTGADGLSYVTVRHEFY